MITEDPFRITFRMRVDALGQATLELFPKTQIPPGVYKCVMEPFYVQTLPCTEESKNVQK